jgi:hypothetical protein
MKKLTVYFDEESYEDLKEFAQRKHASIAALVRYAVDKTFEDELDTIASERALAEAEADPSSSTMSLKEYMAKRFRKD